MRWGNAVFGENIVGVVETEGKVFTFNEPLDSTIFRANTVGIPRTEDELRAAGAMEAELNFDELSFTRPVLGPEKILCVGLNYTDHAEEVGAKLPEYPTIFTKFSNALIGQGDEIVLPAESSKIDWEAELCLVVGREARRVSADEALDYVFGYTVLNDISVRDWQGRTSEWFQGKNWDKTTPFGPVIVSADCLDPVAGLNISCSVDGLVRQNGSTANMIFSPAEVLAYVSTFMTLQPGDLIALGTPAGVGLSIRPRQWLVAGQKVETEIEGIGKLTNICSEPR